MSSYSLTKPMPRFQKTLRKIAARWQLYLLLVPPIVFIFIFSYMPMYGVQIAFRQYNMRLGIWNSPWVGLRWFRMFFDSPVFSRIMVNTIRISLYSLAASIIPPVIIAIAINEARNKVFSKSVQLITYMPHFLSVVVVTSIIHQLFSLSGLVNNVISSLGFDTIQFLGRPGMFPHIFVWSEVWQHSGFNAIIFIAALSGINPELHEAATIDGANIWQRIRHIDIPSLLPTVVILLILRSANILGVGFERVFLLQNPLNMSTSDVIATYVFRMGLHNMEFGLASAVGLFQSVISLMMILIVNTISRRLTESSLW